LPQKNPVELVVCPATNGNPRNSEADIIGLKDGKLLLAYTDFYHGAGHDMSPARISGKISADLGKRWSTPFTVQENSGTENVMEADLLRLKSGEILFFFCMKNSETDCRPHMKKSSDECRTWNEPVAIDKYFGGYVTLNNDRAVQLSTGRIILPAAITPNVYAYPQLEALCFFSDDDGRTWFRSKNILSLPSSWQGADEPGVVELKDSTLMMWFRTTLGHVYKSFSENGGETWSQPESMKVVSPCSPQNIKRIPSTGDLLLVWNSKIGPRRTPLTVAVSKDEGETWANRKNIEDDKKYGYAYPSLTFVKDLVFLTYFVYDENTSHIDLKLKTVPVSWLYRK
jgi:sialidase-1